MILFVLPAVLVAATHPALAAADGLDGFGTFAWLSDTHYDKYYGTPKAAIHKTGSPCNLTSAPTFSAFGCGGSPALIAAAVKAAANATQVLGWPDLDFVLFTGDNARHNAPSEEDVLQDINIVNKLFRDNFPDTNLIELPTLDLGNNDFSSNYYMNVTSHEPCLPTMSADDDGSIESYPKATNEWLKAVAELQSDTFVNELEKTTFACGGYMIRELKPSLSIIILNTVIWSSNWKKFSPEPVDSMVQSDPFGQFKWLETQLQELRNKGKRVYVTGHIPPMLQSFTGSLGQPLYLKEQGKKLDEIITSFNDVVAAVLVAHVHSNELRYNPKYQDDAPPMLAGTSLSPCYTTNPAFRVVKYDSGASESPLDMATFAVDLSDSIPADVTNPFTSIIPSLIDFLDMASLTNKETLKLANKLLPGSADNNQTIWNNYFNAWYQGVPQTQCDDCQRAEACIVGCGFLDDVWQRCNSSSSIMSIDEACGYVSKDPSSAAQFATATWIQMCTFVTTCMVVTFHILCS